ncbi:hypothetical protein C0995_008624, partial [Termitomyces sp. Mi166
MVTKISLLKISAAASLLEHKRAAQDFIVAADAVFTKAQGLEMLAPLHKMVFGLLEGLLDDWCLLNLNSMEWRCKAEVHQACVNLWSLNKQAPWYAEFGKTVYLAAYIKNSLLNGRRLAKRLTKFDNKLLASLLPPLTEYYKGDIGLLQGAKILGGRKGDIMLVLPATWVLVLEKNGAVHGCLWNGVGIRMQKKRPPLEALVIAKHVKLVWAAKAFLKRQGKLLQFFVLEGFKGKGKAKALLVDSEPMGAKQAFKWTELVDSNSNEEEEEERVCIIKKIKRKHVKELIGTRKGREIIELEDLEDEMVAPKTPAVEPLCQTLKPVVLVPSVPRPVPKPIVALASPVAGPSTEQIVPSSVTKPTAAMPISKPVPVKSAGKPAVKGGSVFKDPFMVRQFKLAGTEESGALIINWATEVAAGKVTSIAIQETLQSEDTGNKNDNDKDSNDNDATNVDSSNLDAKILKVLCHEETQPMVPTKVM